MVNKYIIEKIEDLKKRYENNEDVPEGEIKALWEEIREYYEEAEIMEGPEFQNSVSGNPNWTVYRVIDSDGDEIYETEGNYYTVYDSYEEGGEFRGYRICDIYVKRTEWRRVYSDGSEEEGESYQIE